MLELTARPSKHPNLGRLWSLPEWNDVGSQIGSWRHLPNVTQHSFLDFKLVFQKTKLKTKVMKWLDLKGVSSTSSACLWTQMGTNRSTLNCPAQQLWLLLTHLGTNCSMAKFCPRTAGHHLGHLRWFSNGRKGFLELILGQSCQWVG